MSNQNKNTKIALVGYMLAKGGMERVLSTVSQLLHDSGCTVHVIVLEDEVEYPYYGTLLNLGHYSKFQKYFILKKYLKANQFDYVIDFRHRINPWMELVFLHYIYRGLKVIYTVHTSVLAIHFTNKRWVAKQIFDKVHKVVSVSQEMNEIIKKIYQFEKGMVISNCLPEKAFKVTLPEEKLPYKYIIAVGRLVKMKQFDKLIETFCKSGLLQKQIHLVILGEGEEMERLQRQIQDLNLTEFIHLLGFKKHVFSYIQKSEFLVLVSAYEGFGMVILEALALGTPVVSFDCETGPAEMIVDEYNGLLVKNQNFDALQIAISRMTNEQQLYDFCKTNAKQSVAKFSADVTRKKWLTLMHLNTI